MKQEYNPCRKIIEFLLLEYNNSQWKANKKISYNQIKPYSKRYINSWINDNLFGSSKIMLLEVMKSITCPKILESRYRKFNADIWKILDDPTIREQVELDLLFGISPEEIHVRLNGKIKPRVVDILAIKQFKYFFWNLYDSNGVLRSGQVLELIESNRELSREYGHIFKYFNDKQGRKKYEYHYQINKPKEPDMINIYTIIDLTAFDQIDALDKSNFDKLETLTNIQLKNCIVLKTLKTVPDSSGKQNLADIVKLEEE